MKSHSSGRNSRRSRGGSRRRGEGRMRRQIAATKAPAKKSFWQKITAFFTNGDHPVKAAATPSRNGSHQARPTRKPESIDVTTPRLYVGNLSFDATESDLFELFNG